MYGGRNILQQKRLFHKYNVKLFFQNSHLKIKIHLKFKFLHVNKCYIVLQLNISVFHNFT